MEAAIAHSSSEVESDTEAFLIHLSSAGLGAGASAGTGGEAFGAGEGTCPGSMSFLRNTSVTHVRSLPSSMSLIEAVSFANATASS